MTTEGAASGAPAPGGEPRQVPLLNIANVLTVSRLALVPVFLVALLWEDGHQPLWRWAAVVVFLIAAITDRIDGELARKRGLITDFGKIADPIADKALTGAALIGLSVVGDLPWWVTLLIIARELFVTLLRFWVIRHGVIPASRGGKLKTLLQAVAITAYLVPLGGLIEPVRWIVMGAAVLVTVVTGVDYVVQAVRLRARGRRTTATRS